MSYNSDISTKYEKWVVKITVKQKPYYILWGYDTTTFNHDNKIMVDENNKILLFKNINHLLAYTRKSKIVFDRRKTIKWLNKLNEHVRADCHFNIDLLTNKTLKISTRESFTDLINAWSIIDDYAHFTDDKKMLSICQSPQLNNLFHYNCNLYLWTRVEKTIAANGRKLKPEKVILLLNKLYNQFLDKIVIVK